MTPPFKPVVESDESTSNFDPEFTTADIKEVGVGVDGHGSPDEEDPSEDWTQTQIGLPGSHTPNGPLGSDRHTKCVTPISPIGPPSSLSTISASSAGRAIKIGARKKQDMGGSPLTNSIQENFRGFTYSGGESVVTPMSLMGRGGPDDEDEAVADEEIQEVTTEDEFEGESFAGRYSNRRRGIDDDLYDVLAAPS